MYTKYAKIKKIIKKNIGLSQRLPFEDPKAFKENYINDYLIDPYSKKIIKQTNWSELRNSRQKQYYQWEKFAKKNGLEPVFNSLNIGSIPWCFPAYADSYNHAIKFFDWGWKNNIHVFSWPRLPKQIVEQNKFALDRRKRLICFEIN